MTTILTVHGTFASGPETGADWWQKGSACQQHLQELVEADDGKLRFQPFVWDGLNSETSRREAGLALFERIEKLEAQGEAYAIIGHSHGGSVISSALLEGAKRQNALDQLRLWLTIGTPFIQTRKAPLLFARLGLLGKSAYVAILCVSLLMMTVFYPHIPDNYNILLKELQWSPVAAALMIGGEILMFFLPFALFYMTTRYLEAQQLHLYRKSTLNFADVVFRPRWLSLWHPNDEAVQGLRAVKSVNLDIFSKGFAVRPLSMISIVILPAFLLFVILSSGTLVDGVYQSAKSHGLIAPSIESRLQIDKFPDAVPAANAKRIFVLVTSLCAKLSLTEGIHAGEQNWNLRTTLSLVMGLIYLAVVALALAVLVTAAVNGLAPLLSRGLSRRLNPLTMSQLRSTALGSDTTVDRAVDAEDWPMWLGHGYPPLPQPLDTRLQAFSDTAISKVVFRQPAECAPARGRV